MILGLPDGLSCQDQALLYKVKDYPYYVNYKIIDESQDYW
jgi:hypothetical protein